MSLVSLLKKIFNKKVQYSTTPFSNPFSHLQLVEQFVSEVIDFSSEFSGWPARNVIGPYTTYPNYGDLRTAWAPSSPKQPLEYLVVKFKQFVLLDSLEIFETFGPGAIVKISYQNVFYPEKWNVIYFQPSPATTSTPSKARIFSPPLQHYRTKEEEDAFSKQEDSLLQLLLTAPITNTIRIELNTSQNASSVYSELDAIKCIGYGIPSPQFLDSISQQNLSALFELANTFTQKQTISSQTKAMHSIAFQNSQGTICYRMFVDSSVLEKRCVLMDTLTLPSDSLTLQELRMISKQLLRFIYLDQFSTEGIWNENVAQTLVSFGNQLQHVKLIWMSQVCLFLVKHQHANCITSHLVLALFDLYPSTLVSDVQHLAWDTFQFHDTAEHPFAHLLTTDEEPKTIIENNSFDFSTTAFDTSSMKLINQWVETVISASSEYQGWPATNIIGASNTYPNYGDIRTAWAPKPARNSKEFIEFEYRNIVLIKEMHIYETYNPGAVVKISVQDELTDDWKVIYQGPMHQDTLPAEARIFKPKLQQGMIGKRFRIDMDTTKSASWSELDAIQLVGYMYIGGVTDRRVEYLHSCFTKQEEEITLPLQMVFDHKIVSEVPIRLHPFVMRYRLLHQPITSIPAVTLELTEILPKEEIAKLIQCIQLFCYAKQEWFQFLLQFEYQSTFTALSSLANQFQMSQLSAILLYIGSSYFNNNNKLSIDWYEWSAMFEYGISNDFKLAYEDTFLESNQTSLLEIVDIYWHQQLLCKVHKSFLKFCNSFFEKLLSKEWNSNDNAIDLQLDEWSSTATELKIVIQYLYSKEITVTQLNASNAFPIYFCAKELLCDELASDAMQIIYQNVNKQNALEVLETSLNWNITELIIFVLSLLQQWYWHEKTVIFLEQYMSKKEQEWTQWFCDEILRSNALELYYMIKEKQRIQLAMLTSEYITQRSHTSDSSTTLTVSLAKPLELQSILLQYSGMNIRNVAVWCIPFEDLNRETIDKNCVLDNLQQDCWKEIQITCNSTRYGLVPITICLQQFTQFIKIEIKTSEPDTEEQPSVFVEAIQGYRYQLHPSQTIVE